MTSSRRKGGNTNRHTDRKAAPLPPLDEEFSRHADAYYARLRGKRMKPVTLPKLKFMENKNEPKG